LTFIKILLKINLVKKLFISVSGAFTYLSLALPAFAEQSVNPCDSSSSNPISAVLCRLGGNNGGSVATTIRGVVVFFIIIAVVIALMYLLYGGVKWITSKGEKTEVEAARNHIMAAIIGLIVVILAVFILSVVLAAFGISFDSLKIPVVGQ